MKSREIRLYPLPRRCRPLAPILAITLLICPSSGGLLDAHAQSTDCATVIESARTSYFEGRFDQAIASLDHCLRADGIPLEQRREAYRVLGLCHVARDHEDQARTAIHQILLLEPAWQPDPVEDPPAFQRLWAAVKQEMDEGRLVSPRQASQASQTGGAKKWWVLGSLAAAGGAIAVVLFSGGSNDPAEVADLPVPPALPDN